MDIDGFGHLKGKCLKTKRSLKKRNRLSHDANLHRGASTSKNWSRDFHSEVLHITDDPQRMENGEWEAVGIITLEDVIEELLQVCEIISFVKFYSVNTLKQLMPH